jgi:hypothetical protein
MIAAHNGYHPVIAYLGVVPTHAPWLYPRCAGRGRDLPAAQNVPRIRAATDVGNAPMAAASTWAAASPSSARST